MNLKFGNLTFLRCFAFSTPFDSLLTSSYQLESSTPLETRRGRDDRQIHSDPEPLAWDLRQSFDRLQNTTHGFGSNFFEEFRGTGRLVC
jgi:hypothetical protein